MMARNLAQGLRCGALLVVLLTLVFLMSSPAKAQDPFSATQAADGRIEIVITEPLQGAVSAPLVKVFEIIKVGNLQKAFELTPLSQTQGISNGRFIATVAIPAPRVGFDHYDFEVLNYRTASGVESFRGTVILNLSASVVPPATGNKVRVRFAAPNTSNWQNLRTWIAAATATGATVKITLQNGASDTYNVVDSTIESLPNCPRLAVGESFVMCTLRVVLELDKNLPVGLPANLTVKFRDEVFPPSVIAGSLPVEQFRGGITGKVNTDAALAAGKDRDPIRGNVIEAGGSYNTSIKLDRDPTTNKPPQRKTDGSLDLRLATPTRFFADEIEKWWTWTPVQFDALISTGKLTGDNLATNTMRLFTQVQRVITVKRTSDRDWFRFTGEGGASADRDLRVIEYTGSADFRYSPAFLFRTLTDNPLPGRAPTLLVEFMPAGLELGRRHVRRDPIFPADNFIHRFRFAERLELQLPPYLQFKIENRSWVRGEVQRNRFRNFFSTTLTVFPAKLDSNSSAGVFLSYERGVLPPFSTLRTSTFKLGFRVRRKDW